MLTADNLCSTCCRPPASPFRVYGDDGKVLLGCIDNAHTGCLVVGTESAFWHGRPEAVAFRRGLTGGGSKRVGRRGSGGEGRRG